MFRHLANETTLHVADKAQQQMGRISETAGFNLWQMEVHEQGFQTRTPSNPGLQF